MSENINCWRCGRENSRDEQTCLGCGIDSPWRAPSASRNSKVVGSSATEDAWAKFAQRTPPAPSSGSSPVGRISGQFTGSVANRLVAESGVAVTYLYVLGALASAAAVVVLVLVLFSPLDAGAKFIQFLVTILSIVGVWLAVFLVVPFYTYMNLRGQEYRSRQQ